MATTKTEHFNFMGILKGVLIALVIALVGTLIFALITTFTEIELKTASVINTIIGQAAVFVGAMLSCSDKSQGWLKGLLTGIIYSLFSFVIFSIIDGQFVFDQALGLNILFSAIIGTIGGIISVNLKK